MNEESYPGLWEVHQNSHCSSFSRCRQSWDAFSSVRFSHTENLYYLSLSLALSLLLFCSSSLPPSLASFPAPPFLIFPSPASTVFIVHYSHSLLSLCLSLFLSLSLSTSIKFFCTFNKTNAVIVFYSAVWRWKCKFAKETGPRTVWTWADICNEHVSASSIWAKHTSENREDWCIQTSKLFDIGYTY